MTKHIRPRVAFTVVFLTSVFFLMGCYTQVGTTRSETDSDYYYSENEEVSEYVDEEYQYGDDSTNIGSTDYYYDDYDYPRHRFFFSYYYPSYYWGASYYPWYWGWCGYYLYDPYYLAFYPYYGGYYGHFSRIHVGHFVQHHSFRFRGGHGVTRTIGTTRGTGGTRGRGSGYRGRTEGRDLPTGVRSPSSTGRRSGSSSVGTRTSKGSEVKGQRGSRRGSVSRGGKARTTVKKGTRRGSVTRGKSARTGGRKGRSISQRRPGRPAVSPTRKGASRIRAGGSRSPGGRSFTAPRSSSPPRSSPPRSARSGGGARGSGGSRGGARR
ncbi:MAG: hypothetical protein O7D34_03655 [Ignavibacteria bacterium]|nr:hypothetical protein [Ignavibacteria bacterium]